MYNSRKHENGHTPRNADKVAEVQAGEACSWHLRIRVKKRIRATQHTSNWQTSFVQSSHTHTHTYTRTGLHENEARTIAHPRNVSHHHCTNDLRHLDAIRIRGIPLEELLLGASHLQRAHMLQVIHQRKGHSAAVNATRKQKDDLPVPRWPAGSRPNLNK